jgi:glyoxylase-like metal-dependent hydrolase (beta-lactamase superfamily II)
MKLGDLDVFLIRDNTMRVDGGAVFGPIPQTRWRLRLAPSPKNRVELGIFALLVRGPGFVLLVDAGAGTKLDERTRNMYGLHAGSTLLAGLHQHGITPEEITHLLFTHLHTDHVGGATRFTEDRTEVVPCFPNAVAFVQGGEWRQAMSPNELSRISYRIEDFLPLAMHQKVEFMQGSREIRTGLRVEVTGGHTQFHQSVVISNQGRDLIFPGDIMPTSFHVPLTWRSAVDQFPIHTLEAKRRLLQSALGSGTLWAFSHEPTGGFWTIGGSTENPVTTRVEDE